MYYVAVLVHVTLTLGALREYEAPRVCPVGNVQLPVEVQISRSDQIQIRLAGLTATIQEMTETELMYNELQEI